MIFIDDLPKVSIGIPFHNNENTLVDAIRSVFAQTFRNWELILVDDGSTDGSLELAYRIKDPRVRVLSDGKNLKLAARLNQIAREARGEYLARMDADDLMHPQRLEKQVSFLRTHPEVDVVGTAIYSIDDDLNPIGKRGCNSLTQTATYIFCHGLFIHPTILGKTRWFQENPYEEAEWCLRAEDYELWCRTYNQSHFGHIPEPLLFYREIGNFNFAKYRRSITSAEMILRKYGSSSISTIAMYYLFLRQRLRVFVYRCAVELGWERKILAKRNLPLNSQEIKAALEALNIIRSTSVPGLER